MESDELTDRLSDLICGLEDGRLRAELRGIVEDIKEAGEDLLPERRRPETDPLKQTNEEFLVHLLNFGCPTGALIQPYVMAALEDYSNRVIAAKPSANDDGFVPEAAWRETAVHVKERLDSRYPK